MQIVITIFHFGDAVPSRVGPNSGLFVVRNIPRYCMLTAGPGPPQLRCKLYAPTSQLGLTTYLHCPW
jgi:hypothetical protein